MISDLVFPGRETLMARFDLTDLEWLVIQPLLRPNLVLRHRLQKMQQNAIVSTATDCETAQIVKGGPRTDRPA